MKILNFRVFVVLELSLVCQTTLNIMVLILTKLASTNVIQLFLFQFKFNCITFYFLPNLDTDWCPYPLPTSNGNCELAENRQGSSVAFGEEYTRGSRCIMSNVIQKRYRVSFLKFIFVMIYEHLLVAFFLVLKLLFENKFFKKVKKSYSFF